MSEQQRIGSPEFRMHFSLADALELLRTIGFYDFAPTPHSNTWEFLTTLEQQGIMDALTRTEALLSDIGLSPDRKYTVADIVRLQTAIEQALGGER